MPRIPLAATALLLGLAASPVFAQSLPAADPARTLEQNQRAYVAPRPALPPAAAAQTAPAKEKPVATLPAVATRRMELADKAR